jgi:hypothetical protein
MQLHRDDSRDGDQFEGTRDGHDAPRGPFGCANMRAALSAYLDDELARSERFEADAHLLGCGRCRDLIERAESLDRTLRSGFAADLADADGALAREPVDVADLRARVIASIGAEQRRTWIPRAALAAAALALAAGAIVFFRSGSIPASIAPLGPGELARGGETGVDRRLQSAAPTRHASMLAALSPDDRQALYATSVILDTARRTAFEDRARRKELVETARYDELVDRLEDVMPKLPAEDRATVALALDVTERLTDATDNPDEWSRIQEDVSVRNLGESVDELSDR